MMLRKRQKMTKHKIRVTVNKKTQTAPFMAFIDGLFQEVKEDSFLLTVEAESPSKAFRKAWSESIEYVTGVIKVEVL